MPTGVAVAIVVVTLAPPAGAKAAWGWHVPDRDGYVMPGQEFTARALIPKVKPYPELAWAIPDWDRNWNYESPERMPRQRIALGPIEVAPFRLHGDPMLLLEVPVTAPDEPGTYGLVACSEGCEAIARYPFPAYFTVVANRLEIRLRDELTRRDNRIADLEIALDRVRRRARQLEEGLGDQLGYLGTHVRRISALERALEARRPEPQSSRFDLGAAGLAGGIAGLLAATGRRRRRSASNVDPSR